MTPKVLNRRDLPGRRIPDGAVYVGRPSKWGNPFAIGKDRTREQVIAQFRIYLAREVQTGRLDPSELRGKDLVCWCAPEDCHARILIEAANAPLADSSEPKHCATCHPDAHGNHEPDCPHYPGGGAG